MTEPTFEERRTDQMSVRMKPRTRALIERLADAEGVPIAEMIERAITAASAPQSLGVSLEAPATDNPIARLRKERGSKAVFLDFRKGQSPHELISSFKFESLSAVNRFGHAVLDVCECPPDFAGWDVCVDDEE